MLAGLLTLSSHIPEISVSRPVGKYLCSVQHCKALIPWTKLPYELLPVFGSDLLQTVCPGGEQERCVRRLAINRCLKIVTRTQDNFILRDCVGR
jgi:hypothetical protein